ncbi:tyrosine-type recombinase/integrase [Streptomyces sp. NPDC048710]|uniref:tyrosine-type recombinase/integrase n=1 Tax=Streptomyces sp. NPDC048710 TaxID=3365586 RepID=UPI0037134A2B
MSDNLAGLWQQPSKACDDGLPGQSPVRAKAFRTGLESGRQVIVHTFDSNRSFEALCTRAGVRKIRFHDLRHTCASLLHEQGADARMIMEFLGHSSIRVTMDIYTFVRLDSQRSAFDRVGDALRGDDNGPDDDDGAAGVFVVV